MASQYDEGEPLELPLKFNDIVDVYYDKMRPPKTDGKKEGEKSVAFVKILNIKENLFHPS